MCFGQFAAVCNAIAHSTVITAILRRCVILSDFRVIADVFIWPPTYVNLSPPTHRIIDNEQLPLSKGPLY